MKQALPLYPPVLADAARICEAASRFHARTNDLSFVNIYLLQNKYNICIAIANRYFYRHYAGDGRLQGYAFPLGDEGRVEEAFKAIEDDAELCSRPLRFCTLTEEQAKRLARRYGKCFTWNNDPGDSDYLYRRSDLAELPGTAYHKKRNHIARFAKQYPDWKFESLTSERRADAMEVAEGWLAGAGEQTPSLLHEAKAIRRGLELWQELSIIGGLIYIAGRPAAMSMASLISPNVADIHYEKCLPQYRDAYPIINRELARLLETEFINREEDLNVPGLRQAKLSYHPCDMIPRFSGSVC